MKANYKAKGSGNISMSLYEINQSLMSQMPSLDEEKLRELIDELNKFVQEHENSQYFMYLCKELSSYTMLVRAADPEFHTIGNAIVTLARDWQKEIVSYEDCNDHFEIWLRDLEGEALQANCFMFFPYDEGVVTYGE